MLKQWLIENWPWAVPVAALVADNVVKVTPNKKDDLILDTIKRIVMPVWPTLAGKIGVNKK